MVDMIFRLFQFDSTIYAVAPQVPSAALPEENADRLIEAAAGMEPRNEIVVNSQDIHAIQEVNTEKIYIVGGMQTALARAKHQFGYI